MKVLVFSDSHGANGLVEEMLNKEKDCSTVFFLGDGIDEAEKMKDRYRDKKFILVKGNNDWYSQTDTEAYKYIDGLTIMSCHGHKFNVRFSLRSLIDSAESVRANIALYGHTHKSGMYNDPVTGICAINPGALCEGKYAVLTIEKGAFDIEFKSVY
ncbi:MAG: YfcE family phosphodiesterase [Clostridia bacterium]|nr:YfcE family phosphodiesterase [Clostridia bacterium]